MKSDAVISEDGLFRYLLLRVWDTSKSVMCIVMLNPSTADAELNDPTVRKVMGFAQRLGYGGVAVFNLFAFRTSSPLVLARMGWQVGPENDTRFQRWLREYVEFSPTTPVNVFCAWGNIESRAHLALERTKVVLAMIRAAGARPVAFKLTQRGHPTHPSRLPYGTTIVEIP